LLPQPDPPLPAAGLHVARIAAAPRHGQAADLRRADHRQSDEARRDPLRQPDDRARAAREQREGVGLRYPYRRIPFRHAASRADREQPAPFRQRGDAAPALSARMIRAAVASFLRFVLGAALLIGVALNFANITGRYVFGAPIIWAEEALIYLLVW